MRKRNVKYILGAMAVSGVLGVGVAAAATSRRGPAGMAPR